MFAVGQGPVGEYEQAGRQTERTLKTTVVPSAEGRLGITLGSFGVWLASSRALAVKLTVLPVALKPEPWRVSCAPTGPELGERKVMVEGEVAASGGEAQSTVTSIGRMAMADAILFIALSEPSPQLPPRSL